MDEKSPETMAPAATEHDALAVQQAQEAALLEREKFEFDKQKQQLEILQFFHAAGLGRWKDRRENEWKLNYAIWAAIAGLDALLLHDKSTISIDWRLLLGGGLVAVCLHVAYLWPTIERAISEIELQGDAERAIRKLISDQHLRVLIKEDHIGGAVERCKGRPKYNWLWKRYGLFAPIGLTTALLLLGGYLLSGHTKAGAKESDAKTIIAQ